MLTLWAALLRRGSVSRPPSQQHHHGLGALPPERLSEPGRRLGATSTGGTAESGSVVLIDVFVVVIGVRGVAVPVVQVVNVVVVFHRPVTAALAVDMVVLGRFVVPVFLRCAHLMPSFSGGPYSNGSCLPAPVQPGERLRVRARRPRIRQ